MCEVVFWGQVFQIYLCQTEMFSVAAGASCCLTCIPQVPRDQYFRYIESVYFLHVNFMNLMSDSNPV